MKSLIAFFLLISTFIWASDKSFAQAKESLFANSGKIEFQLSTSIEELRLSESDTVYFPSILRYRTEGSEWDSLEVLLRAKRS